MKTFLAYFFVVALVLIVMVLKKTYDMNKQCVDSTKYYYSLNMKFSCKEQ